MKSFLCLLLMVVLTPIARAALTGDGADGKRLHDANCMSCHDTGVYVRQNRSVRSLDALRAQVEGCSHMAKKQFSTVETHNLIKYLNDQFYKFQ